MKRFRFLKGLRPKYEAHHKAKLTDEALETAVKFSERYITGRFLPDKAIDVMDEAGARARINSMTRPPDVKEIEKEIEEIRVEKEAAIKAQDFEKAASLRDKEKQTKEKLDAILTKWREEREEKEVLVTGDDMMHIISKVTGVPLQRMEAEGNRRSCSAMEAELKQRVIGQDEAVTAISKALAAFARDLKDPKRPIGSFVFLGPTGVGKTFSRARSRSSCSAIRRVDPDRHVGVHGEVHRVAFDRVASGYVGYEEGGQLSEAVRRRPYSVVLFDEIEKAHPDVMHLLLQILEDGKITDSLGRKIDFRNTIIIMTSNVGAELIKRRRRWASAHRADGHDYDSMRDKILEETKRVFKPEFLNRLDEIIVFHSARQTDLMQIVDLEVDKVKRAHQSQGSHIELRAKREGISDRERDTIRNTARVPMRRAVERYLEDPLAEELLRGNVKAGDVVDVTVPTDGKLSSTCRSRTAGARKQRSGAGAELKPGSSIPSQLRPRMRVRVRFLQPLDGDVRVDLRRRKTGVAE
jgi:ATP-dependent Clp protease ATP-binding subunit ClpC